MRSNSESGLRPTTLWAGVDKWKRFLRLGNNSEANLFKASDSELQERDELELCFSFHR